jgi:hypothetical protein
LEWADPCGLGAKEKPPMDSRGQSQLKGIREMKRKLGRLKKREIVIPEFKKPQIVEVTWLDAANWAGNVAPGKYRVGALLNDVGYLLYEDKDWIVIAQEAGDDSARRTLDIPMYSVQSIRKVK